MYVIAEFKQVLKQFTFKFIFIFINHSVNNAYLCTTTSGSPGGLYSTPMSARNASATTMPTNATTTQH